MGRGLSVGFWAPGWHSRVILDTPYNFLDEVLSTSEPPLSEASEGKCKPNGTELNIPITFGSPLQLSVIPPVGLGCNQGG